MTVLFNRYSSRHSQQSFKWVGPGVLSTLTDAETYSVNQLLTSHRLGPIASNTPTRVYTKAIIKGMDIYSRENKRVKRRNSYTVSFSSESGVCYGIVEKFSSVCGHNVAFITELATCTCITSIAPPQTLEATITIESKECLFKEYLTYNEDAIQCILVDQISTKCFNLTTNNLNLLTQPVNNVECE